MSIVLRLNVMALVLPVLACGMAVAADVGVSKCFKGPTGLQLYSLRDIQKSQGVAATLDAAKAFGFKYVEVADLGGLSPAEFKTRLTTRAGARRQPFPLRPAPRRRRRRRPGCQGPGTSLRRVRMDRSHGPLRREAVPCGGGRVQPGRQALAKHGLKFYYHNHGYEFEPYDQGTLFDLLVAETDPQNVFFQMDVMWTVFPGQDPAKLLEKYPNRWLLMHLKDLRKGVPLGSLSGGTDLKNDVTLGTGQVDWPTLLPRKRPA